MYRAVLFSALLTLAANEKSVSDSWKYPKHGPGVSGTTNFGKDTLGTYFSREVDEDFGAILKWYAKQINSKSLAEEYANYLKRKPGAPDVKHGAATATDIQGGNATTANITYYFSPEHEHATILQPNADGGVAVLSIASSNGKTTIQFGHVTNKR